MKKTINYKKKLCLATIPLIGWVIVILSGIKDIKEVRGLFFAVGYFFASVLATALICVLIFVIGKFAIIPIAVEWIKILMFIILCLLMNYSMTYIAIGIEYGFIKYVNQRDDTEL